MWADQGSAPLEVAAEPEMMLGVEWSLLGPQWSANTCKVCRGRVVLQIWEAWHYKSPVFIYLFILRTNSF